MMTMTAGGISVALQQPKQKQESERQQAPPSPKPEINILEGLTFTLNT